MRTLNRTPLAHQRWMRHFVHRAEVTRTTWTLRLGVLAITVIALWLTVGWWSAAIGRSLVCDSDHAPSDAILIDNFDTQYLVFERASDLRREGRAPRVLVPVTADVGTTRPHQMAVGFVDVMARISRLGPYEVVPAREVEPISLNVSRDVLAFLQQQSILSITVVSPLFRSRRSSLVYAATLEPAGIKVSCEPSAGLQETETWTRTWHGIQNVVEQFIKLQYYRWYVLPFGRPDTTAARPNRHDQ